MLIVIIALALLVAYLVLTGPKRIGPDSTALTIADELELEQSGGELLEEARRDVERARKDVPQNAE